MFRNEVKTREFNILIVEDNDKTFQAINESLAVNPEYKLHRVTCGQEAINLAKEGYFVAIVTEMQIGDMNGLELVRRLKKIDQRINIIGLTVYAFANLGVEAMKEGLYAYLMKPLNPEELNLVLRRAIENTFLLIQAGQRKYYQDIATMDGLTGVYNHRHFHEMLDWNISHLNRSPQAFSIFIIDLDDFKKYNDTKGHVEGDKLLHNFAQLLVSSTRDNDMVFRYGGEEFAVILSQTDQFSAQKVGERLLGIVRGRLPITMSMGLATFPLNAQIKSELVIRADKALYRAKKTGKNRLCVYDEKIDI